MNASCSRLSVILARNKPTKRCYNHGRFLRRHLFCSHGARHNTQPEGSTISPDRSHTERTTNTCCQSSLNQQQRVDFSARITMESQQTNQYIPGGNCNGLTTTLPTETYTARCASTTRDSLAGSTTDHYISCCRNRTCDDKCHVQKTDIRKKPASNRRPASSDQFHQGAQKHYPSHVPIPCATSTKAYPAKTPIPSIDVFLSAAENLSLDSVSFKERNDSYNNRETNSASTCSYLALKRD